MPRFRGLNRPAPASTSVRVTGTLMMQIRPDEDYSGYVRRLQERLDRLERQRSETLCEQRHAVIGVEVCVIREELRTLGELRNDDL